MKKVFLFAAVISAFSFASCKKDHTCTCTSTTSNGFTSSQVTTYFKSKKGDARLLCTQQASQTNGTAPVASTGTKTTCKLK